MTYMLLLNCALKLVEEIILFNYLIMELTFFISCIVDTYCNKLLSQIRKIEVGCDFKMNLFLAGGGGGAGVVEDCSSRI